MKSFSDGDALFGPMLNAIISAFQGTSVIDGCEVETSGYWDLRFSVAAGSVQIGGTIVSVAGGSSMLGAASAFERYDLVTITSAGEIHVVQGTEAQKCPAIPANECLIAIIRLPAGSTVINTADVLDARLVGLRLSDVAITAAKNWNGYAISNVGALSSAGMVAAATDDEKYSYGGPTISTTPTTAWTKCVEHRVPAMLGSGSNIRIKITASAQYESGYVQVWINGSPVGAEHQVSTGSSQSFSDDISVDRGDLVQIYARSSVEGYYQRIEAYSISHSNVYGW